MLAKPLAWIRKKTLDYELPNEDKNGAPHLHIDFPSGNREIPEEFLVKC
jgi:hypothetical protein